MAETLVLIPGLACTSRLFEPQIEALSDGRTVVVADHMRDDSIPAIAARLLREAPERFALAGLSMGGYVAMEVMRQAPERVSRLGTARHERPPRHGRGEPGSRAADRPRRGRPLRGHPFQALAAPRPSRQSGRSGAAGHLARHAAGDRRRTPISASSGQSWPVPIPGRTCPASRSRLSCSLGRGCHHSAGHRTGDGRDDRMVVARRRARGGAPVDPRAAGAGDSGPASYG